MEDGIKKYLGIWVAKFEAGYASGNNTTKVKESNVNYNNYNNEVIVRAVENGTSIEGRVSNRNWLDGIYGNTETKIKYPVFKGTTYSMNLITINDAYNISRALTDSGNIYGLSNTDTDSHLIKNSEWGAVSYLSRSKYGQNEKEITINNANLNSGNTSKTKVEGNKVASVYAITGCTSNTTDTETNQTTIEAINSVSGNIANSDGIYVWNQKTGQNASTTGTIYGIYDMNGGTWERVSSYIANGNEILQRYGENMAYEKGNLKTTSTKYTTVYPNNEIGETDIDKASQKNFLSNKKIYGDAIREVTSSKAGTSDIGWNTSSLNNNDSVFPSSIFSCFVRGGGLWNSLHSGIFAYTRTIGDPYYADGFRTVLIAL